MSTEPTQLNAALRERCFRCFRPQSLCFCDSIPQIDNRTDILLVQHVGERSHRFNTARIVKQSLRSCRLLVDHNRRFANLALPIRPGAGLLYPSPNARVLTELPPEERPQQLVIVDGTWHQAKTIVRDVPQLAALPRYRLRPTAPGQYRIRREPNSESLSTLEATVQALRALEPETLGLDELLGAFNRMIEEQLEISASRNVTRCRVARHDRPRHVPAALFQDPDKLIVAYGEAAPGRPGERPSHPLPVSWVAERLGTRERVAWYLRQPQPLPDTVLKHMRVSDDDLRRAVHADAFRQAWHGFLRCGDLMVVYHHGTFRLLKNIDAVQPRCLVLKSIYGNRRSGFRSLEGLLALEGLTSESPATSKRAHHRLEMAITLVKHLRS